ncbi:MAG TPA: DUF4399 domain-containing protein [Puia sp.]|nr:DUF4399 domain-containing protein [Puia sp.]
MRTTHFIPAALLMGLFACNNASDKTAASTDTTAAMGKDTMQMKHAADTSKAITPLPEVPAGAKVFFKNLKNGQTVKSPVKVDMGVDGLKVDTAGVVMAGTGHHHLFIDAEDSLPAGTVVPKDDKHLHFGKGQTSAEVKLTPGKHKLTLQFADGIHRSYGAKLATTIDVEVK